MLEGAVDVAVVDVVAVDVAVVDVEAGSRHSIMRTACCTPLMYAPQTV